MKKYLSLFSVLLLACIVNIHTVGATLDANINGDVRVGFGDEGINTEEHATVSTQEQKRTKMEEVFRSKIQAQTDLRVNIQNMRVQARAKMDALRAEIKNEKDASKAKMKELRIKVREGALERFDNAVERMSKLNARVSAEISKLKIKGVDVTAAESFMVTAETKLTDVKAKVASANALLSVSINELGVEQKAQLKTLAKDIQTLLVEMHKAIHDAIQALKDATKIKIEANINAHTETETTTN